MTMPAPGEATSAYLKSCCAAAYESEWATLLFGESLHPGGLALTERLVELLALPAGGVVLDVACGRGASAIHLAKRFGRRIIGVDLSARSLASGSTAARDAGVGNLATFAAADAERLPFADASIDAVISECALCTMPDRAAALRECARVLRPGGAIAISDIVRSGPLPDELSTVLAWVACVADAQPVEEYVRLLRAEGFSTTTVERHDDALRRLMVDVRKRLALATIVARLGKLPLDATQLETAQRLASSAEAAIRDGLLGYAVVSGRVAPRK